MNVQFKIIVFGDIFVELLSIIKSLYAAVARMSPLRYQNIHPVTKIIVETRHILLLGAMKRELT